MLKKQEAENSVKRVWIEAPWLDNPNDQHYDAFCWNFKIRELLAVKVKLSVKDKKNENCESDLNDNDFLVYMGE